MKIEFLVLADSAQVANGKLFILGGGWGVWRSQHFPLQIQIGLALNILINGNELGGKYQLAVTIKDEANIQIVPEIKAEMVAGRTTEEFPTGTVHKLPVAFNLGLLVSHPGKYTIQATMGSSHVETFFSVIYVGKSAEIVIAPEDAGGERGN